MPDTVSHPPELHREIVRPEWCDYNGHMNLAFYVLVFDHATDAFWNTLGIGLDYRDRTNNSTFGVESHITYDREVLEGDEVRCTTQLLGFDDTAIAELRTASATCCRVRPCSRRMCSDISMPIS